MTPKTAHQRTSTLTKHRWKVMAAAGLLVSLTGVLPAAAEPKATPACPAERPDEQSALAAAQSCGGKVRVAAATTETSLTWANSDGSLSTQTDAGPSRFKQDGTWVDIDADLERQADGTVAAEAHPADLELFGGDTTATKTQPGDRPLISVDTPATMAGNAEQTISLDWKGSLPKPVLDGDTATYTDAKPGMDVVVETTAAGFRQHTILKSKQTGPVSITLPIKLDGLTAKRTADNALEFLDAKGAVVGTMPAPSMWDSRLDPVSQLPAHVVPVAYTLATKGYGVDITLTPAADFLDDPAVQYPVTIDPDVNFKSMFDTYIQKGVTTDMSTSGELVVGVDGAGNPARSFLNWDTSAIRGKRIVEAHLGLFNTLSSTCSTSRHIEVHAAALAATTSRWTSPPTVTAAVSAMTQGRHACPSEPAGGYISTPLHALDALIQSWADSTKTQQGMALTAPSETDYMYYKRFTSSDASSGRPYIYYTYTSVPRTAGCTGGTDNDFNGDGIRDTVIADPKAIVNGVAEAGSVQVINGADKTVTTLRQGANGVPDTAEAGDQFGASIAVYDTNLDGCSDLAVSAPFEDNGTIRDAGSVYLIYGSPTGLGKSQATIAIEQGRALTESRGTVADTPEAEDWFGYALSAGLTAIGEPYLIIGAPGEDLNGVTNVGMVHYLRDTLNTTVDLVAAGATLGADDRAGFSIASTPFHIAIGRPGANNFTGAVSTFTHAYHSDPLRPLSTIIQGATYGDTAERDDQFGKSLAMIPYRSVGAAENVQDSLLVVGVPGEDFVGKRDAGQIQEYLLTQSTITPVALLNQTSPGITGGNDDGDYFGEQVTAVNLNPKAEATTTTVLVAVGAPGEDIGGTVDAGRVHVFAGGTATVTDLPIERVTGSLPGSPSTQELIGAWLSSTPQTLIISSPHLTKAAYGIPWSAITTRNSTPTATYQPGAGGLSADAVAFGTSVR
ncbi:DNRLRE domain-containing protein [Actinoplanes regularis]|uniref:DNRLRE domain-containing protein n=1 Tax=Actinoplanes regularis TaxID=52697 RepID=UPI0024A12D01|nr:DNRLRE domain-containing protein [Actinoplanes regularis]GLW35252.1 hypothetical protein Areg01_81880 [Actinoplanes regularis]